jgi:hypothetical protein
VSKDLGEFVEEVRLRLKDGRVLVWRDEGAHIMADRMQVICPISSDVGKHLCYLYPYPIIEEPPCESAE